MSGSAGRLSATLLPGCDSDAALCRRAAGGDRSAFGELVERHENRLRAFLTHLAGADLGDELAQESFVKAWQSAGQYRGQAQYGSWLCSIGWRCFIDRIRSERSETLKREASALATELLDHGTQDRNLDLQRALARLDPVERAALILCDGHGWSHSEAATILRVPLGTLKTVVARAKRKCREMLMAEVQ